MSWPTIRPDDRPLGDGRTGFDRASSDNAPAAALEQSSHHSGATGELATLLLAAIRSPVADGEAQLDRITAWLRTHHAQAARIWDGWHEAEGRLDRGRIKRSSQKSGRWASRDARILTCGPLQSVPRVG